MELASERKRGILEIDFPLQKKTGEFLITLSNIGKRDSYDKIKDLGKKYGLEVKTFLTPLNLVSKYKETGYIFDVDLIILYENFFLLISGLELESEAFCGLVEYKDIELVGENEIRCTFVECSLNEKERKKILSNVKKAEKREDIILTTTNLIDGYTITDYIDVVTFVEVYKLDVLQELTANLGDLVGGRSRGYSKKFMQMHEAMLRKVKQYAKKRGGNAVIGLSFDIEFVETPTGEKRLLGLSRADVIERKLMLSVSGTIVRVQKVGM